MINQVEQTEIPIDPNQEYRRYLLEALREIKAAETEEEALAIIEGVGVNVADRLGKTFAHELNNQLTSINGGYQLLQTGLDPKVADGIVLPSIEHLTKTADNLFQNRANKIIFHTADSSVPTGSIDIANTFTEPRYPSTTSTIK